MYIDTLVIKCSISVGTGDRTQDPILNNLLAVGRLVRENQISSLTITYSLMNIPLFFMQIQVSSLCHFPSRYPFIRKQAFV